MNERNYRNGYVFIGLGLVLARCFKNNNHLNSDRVKKFIEFKQSSRKIEFAHFYKRCVAIVEDYKPENLLISVVYDRAKESVALADGMAISTGKYPLTNEQKVAMRKMDKSVSAFKRYVGIRMKQIELEGDEGGETLAFYGFVDSYLDGYWAKNTYQKTSSMEKMLAVYEGDAAMNLVVEKETLGAFMAKVIEDFEGLNAVYKSRRKSIASIEKLRTAEVKRTLYFRLRELFAYIEMAELVHADIDYSGLIDELNEEIRRFNRATKPLASPDKSRINAGEQDSLDLCPNSLEGEFELALVADGLVADVTVDATVDVTVDAAVDTVIDVAIATDSVKDAIVAAKVADYDRVNESLVGYSDGCEQEAALSAKFVDRPERMFAEPVNLSADRRGGEERSTLPATILLDKRRLKRRVLNTRGLLGSLPSS